MTSSASSSASFVEIDTKLDSTSSFQTSHRESRAPENRTEKWKGKNVTCCKLLLSISVPLMIGIFTLVTTFQELQSNRQAREQELKIALYDGGREYSMAEELRREIVFDQYLRDISDLLKQKITNNLTDEDLILARVKTLTTFRQLDTKRKEYLLQFLYDSNLIKMSSISAYLLDLSGINLNNITFHSLTSNLVNRKSFSLRYIKLDNVFLINSSFINIDLFHAKFQGSVISGRNFSHTTVSRSNFVNCLLDDCDFTGAFVTSVNFTGASLNRSKIVLTGEGNIFKNAIFPNGTHEATLTKINLIKNNNEEDCSTIASSTTTQKSNYKPTFPPLSKPQNQKSTWGRWFSYLPHIIYRQKINGICVFASSAKLAILHMDLDVTHYSLLIDADKAQYLISAMLGSTNGNQKSDYTNLHMIFRGSANELLKTMLGIYNSFILFHSKYLFFVFLFRSLYKRKSS